eukprot:COSAG01_NODE_9259_length_2500_cov_33.558101_2_plen_174_part_00
MDQQVPCPSRRWRWRSIAIKSHGSIPRVRFDYFFRIPYSCTAVRVAIEYSYLLDLVRLYSTYSYGSSSYPISFRSHQHLSRMTIGQKKFGGNQEEGLLREPGKVTLSTPCSRPSTPPRPGLPRTGRMLAIIMGAGVCRCRRAFGAVLARRAQQQLLHFRRWGLGPGQGSVSGS